jgi:hypothetical protein
MFACSYVTYSQADDLVFSPVDSNLHTVARDYFRDRATDMVVPDAKDRLLFHHGVDGLLPSA